MGYNRDNREPPAPRSRKSRSERVRHFVLFAALPVGLGALAAAVTLSLPGGADDSLRDVFTAAYINGVAAITVAGVLQMWFTMGETERANQERARADWEKSRADWEKSRADAKQTEIEDMRILLAEKDAERAGADAERARTDAERARADEERARANELQLLLAEERAKATIIEAARAAVDEARANLSLLMEARDKADAADPKLAGYIAQLNAEIPHAIRNLRSAQTTLNQLLTGRGNGQQPE